MADVLGILFVFSASVSWYISKSLQSKVDPDKDGYGEKTKYVKYVEGGPLRYAVETNDALDTDAMPMAVIFIERNKCLKGQHESLASKVNWGKYDVSIECNTETNTLKRLRNPDAFIKTVTKKVADLLKAGRLVLLAGHFSGGEVVVKVAENIVSELNVLNNENIHLNDTDTANLRVATFGSKYISPLGDLQVTHYMFKDDVATSMNGNKFQQELDANGEPVPLPYVDQNTNIMWLDHNYGKVRGNSWWNLTRNETSKRLNDSYADIIEAVVRNRGERLNPTKIELYD